MEDYRHGSKNDDGLVVKLWTLLCFWSMRVSVVESTEALERYKDNKGNSEATHLAMAAEKDK